MSQPTSRPLRIAWLSEHALPPAESGSFDVGGQHVYVSHAVRGLARRGHSVDVFSPTELRVWGLHGLAGLPGLEWAAHAAMHRSAPYDVLHASDVRSGLAALRLRAAFGTPLAMTFHGLGLAQGDRPPAGPGPEIDVPMAARIESERRLVREADRLIAQCPQHEDDLVRLYGAEAERIATVPCGVDLSEFGPADPDATRAARAALGIEPGEFVVLHVGRLAPHKGIDNVIRAVGRLQSRLPLPRQVRLLVGGGEAIEPSDLAAPEILRLRRVARQAEVADRVLFAGRRSRAELRQYYTACDVLVATPRSAPFGIAPLQAMACGRPVVGAAVGGIQHSVVDGVTGYLVPPQDPDALADCLQHLQANPALAAAMGRAGMRRVRSLFTWESVAGQLADAFGTLRTERETGRSLGTRGSRVLQLLSCGRAPMLGTAVAAVESSA